MGLRKKLARRAQRIDRGRSKEQVTNADVNSKRGDSSDP